MSNNTINLATLTFSPSSGSTTLTAANVTDTYNNFNNNTMSHQPFVVGRYVVVELDRNTNEYLNMSQLQIYKYNPSDTDGTKIDTTGLSAAMISTYSGDWGVSNVLGSNDNSDSKSLHTDNYTTKSISTGQNTNLLPWMYVDLGKMYRIRKIFLNSRDSTQIHRLFPCNIYIATRITSNVLVSNSYDYYYKYTINYQSSYRSRSISFTSYTTDSIDAQHYSDWGAKYYKAIIDSNVTSIDQYAFSEINNSSGRTELVKRLYEVEYDGTELTAIGNGAFEGCNYLREISDKLLSNLTTIGDYTFQHCYSLIIPAPFSNNKPKDSKITEIKIAAFRYAFSNADITLTSLVLPISVTTLGKSVFSDTAMVSYVDIPSHLAKYVGTFYAEHGGDGQLYFSKGNNNYSSIHIISGYTRGAFSYTINSKSYPMSVGAIVYDGVPNYSYKEMPIFHSIEKFTGVGGNSFINKDTIDEILVFPGYMVILSVGEIYSSVLMNGGSRLVINATEATKPVLLRLGSAYSGSNIRDNFVNKVESIFLFYNNKLIKNTV